MIRDIKQAAKEGNTAATKILAKSLVRLRAQIAKLHASSAQLRGVSTQMTVSPRAPPASLRPLSAPSLPSSPCLPDLDSQSKHARRSDPGWSTCARPSTLRLRSAAPRPPRFLYVCARAQTAAATQTVSTAVAGASKAMVGMQQAMDPKKINQTMQQFAKVRGSGARPLFACFPNPRSSPERRVDILHTLLLLDPFKTMRSLTRRLARGIRAMWPLSLFRLLFISPSGVVHALSRVVTRHHALCCFITRVVA